MSLVAELIADCINEGNLSTFWATLSTDCVVSDIVDNRLAFALPSVMDTYFSASVSYLV